MAGGVEGSQPIAAVEIASQGDVIIEITSRKGLATLRVASQVLCATSPVFRAMLGTSSHFKEACELREKGGSSEPYHLTLQDDPEALGVILLALHCQNDRVPQKIAFGNLYSLAVICDKYDCAAGVSLWIDIWVKPWRLFASSSSKYSYERWLFIAWAFDIQDTFKELTKKFILEGLPLLGDLWGPGVYLYTVNLPKPVMRAIVETRKNYITSMAGTTFSYYERYFTSWGKGKSRCKCSPPSEDCDAIILGSLMKSFLSLGFKDSDQFTQKSIKAMSDGIQNLRIEFLSTAHKRCGALPELKAGISEIVSKIDGLDIGDYKAQKTKAAAAKWDIFSYGAS